MRIFLIHNIKNTALRVSGLLFVLVLLYFCLPPFYERVSAASEDSDDFTELNEPLRVQNEVDPANLSAWFNSLYE